MEKTTVMFADDHIIALEGYKNLLLRDERFVILPEANRVRKAIRYYFQYEPDILVVDLKFPDGCGDEILQAVWEKKISCHIVILTGEADPEHLSFIREKKIGAYLDKADNVEKLAEIFSELKNDPEPFLSPRVSSTIFLRNPPKKKKYWESFNLTRREKEVTDLILEGKKSPSIARALHIESTTVDQYAKSILSKAGLRSRLELIVHIYKNFLL